MTKGVTSDDGFTIGRFTLAGTANLVIGITVISAVGGALWVLVRGLRFGPRWWRLVSVPLAITILVSSALIHADGVDFRVLHPLGLALLLTAGVPVIATSILTWLGDRWIGSDETFWQVLPAWVRWVARAALAALVVGAFIDLVPDLAEISRRGLL